MKKFKVVYDKEGCIGAGPCAAIHPDIWSFDYDDNKANLTNAKQREDGKWELEISQEEYEKHFDSAQSCPVNVIHLTDLETGEELI
jgi:ferredoxin